MRKVLLSLALPLTLASCGLFRAPTNPDTTKPTPTDVTVALSGNATITGAGAQVWTATTTGPVSSVDFYLDGVKLGTDTQAPFEVSQTLSSANNGTHTLKAVANGAGGQQASNQLAFTVNISTAPQPPVPTPVSVTLSGITNITSAGPQSWTALTTGSVSSVDFYLDGVKLGTDTQAPFEVSQTLSSANNGTHTLKAVANGTNGQQASNQLNLYVNIPVITQPKTLFIPAVGAAVGTGDGTPLGTVYVSPNVQEVEFMHLLNEARTKGTVNGVDVRAGTCLANVQPGTLKPLTFNGVIAYASRKHAEYMGSWGMEGHYETNTSHPKFYGYSPEDRIARAGRELGAPGSIYGGEVISGADESEQYAAQAVTGLLNSPPHCAIMANPAQVSVGVGYVQSNWGYPGNLVIYPNTWVAAFGR